MAKNNYNKIQALTATIADLQNAMAVLEWDQEVYMPPRGAARRGQQIATLAGLAHKKLTSKKMGSLLKAVVKEKHLSDDELVNVQGLTEDYLRLRKLPSAFVAKLAAQASICYESWMKARAANDVALFLPDLEIMVALKREQADLLGYTNHPYNALLGEYDPGMTIQRLDELFSICIPQLTGLLSEIKAKQMPQSTILKQHFNKEKQWQFTLRVLEEIGYDFSAGRQDLSEHPFSISFSPSDVRITSRVDENDFSYLFWSSIHEGGHALYEQGLGEEHYGLPLSHAASLSIHESQSRFWENHIAKSKSFWKIYLPELKAIFPNQFEATSVQEFWQAANFIEPSPIRTEADELTYHLHIFIRYEIEKQLIGGTIAVKDIYNVWNEMYKQYLGIDIKDAKSGVLQDVHWAHGGLGYFPTYSLGSFYAAQFAAAIEKFLDFDLLEKGDFKAIKVWLNENIHRHGKRYLSEELCKQATGEYLNLQYFIDYIRFKYL